MDLKSKLYLIDDNGDKFMGIGVMWLLERISSTSSLRKAAADMDISYSKAFTMIKNLETGLGMNVIIRQKGGQSRDGAQLTEFGLKFLELYRNFNSTAKRALEEPYEEFCSNLSKLMEEEQNG